MTDEICKSYMDASRPIDGLTVRRNGEIVQPDVEVKAPKAAKVKAPKADAP